MNCDGSRAAISRIIEDCTNNGPLDGLLRDFFEAATRYAHLRAEWYLARPEERREMDEGRTRAHNAFIDCCNILSRNMASQGLDVSWRADLGSDRKVIGDFACFVHAYLGFLAR